MSNRITEGTIDGDNIYAKNLVKEVTVVEWNELQETLRLLQIQISTVSGAVHTTNKGDK